MTWGSNDKGLMYCRTFLEKFWQNNLTNDDRDAWLELWLTTPPTDGRGRYYTPYPRTNMQQTRRDPPTIYAWAVMPAVYYADSEPPARPPADAPPIVTWQVYMQTPVNLCVQSSISGTLTGDEVALFYLAKNHSATSAAKITACNFARAVTELTDGQTIALGYLLNNGEPLTVGDSYTIWPRLCGTGRGAVPQMPPITATVTAL